MMTGGPAIILVEPQLGENIGMVARAMANFGLSELRLVNPRDGWPNEKARAAASRADHVIDGAAVFDDLRCGARRPRISSSPRRRASATASSRCAGRSRRRGSCANAHRSRPDATGILFGRERFGLFNEEVGLADEIVTFPVNPAFASLNIAQAVLLMSYEWMKSGLERETDTAFAGPELEPAPQGASARPVRPVWKRRSMRAAISGPAQKKAKMVDNLRAVLTRPGFAEAEIQVLRGVVSSLDRFSPAMRRGEGSPGDDPRRLPAAVQKAKAASDDT